MRIALVSVHTSPGATPGTGDAGGMNVVVREHARSLAARGHDVHVITRATTSVPAGERVFESDGDRSSTTSGAVTGKPRLHALAVGEPDLRKNALPAVLPEFSRQLARLGPFDAVHAHYWLSGIAALPLAAASGVRLAHSFHTVAAQKDALRAPGDPQESPARHAAERALTRNAFIVTGSTSERDAIVAHYGAPGYGSTVIHPGVDTALFRPRGSHRSRPDDIHNRAHAHDRGESGRPRPLRVTVLGRVQPLKGQDLAVRAAGEIARRDPELWAHMELVIAGEPTPGAEPYAARVQQLADELGIADRVRFLSALSRAEAADLLATSDAVIVASHSETFGLVALEAAACGVPTVVGAHTGLVEAAPAGVASVQVTGRDPAVWAQALRELLRDPDRRAGLGRTAREFALTHSWDAQAAKLERLYRELARRVARHD